MHDSKSLQWVHRKREGERFEVLSPEMDTPDVLKSNEKTYFYKNPVLRIFSLRNSISSVCYVFQDISEIVESGFLA